MDKIEGKLEKGEAAAKWKRPENYFQLGLLGVEPGLLDVGFCLEGEFVLCPEPGFLEVECCFLSAIVGLLLRFTSSRRFQKHLKPILFYGHISIRMTGKHCQ